MYVRTKSSPRTKNRTVQIVASERVEGKIKQRVVRHIGSASPGDELDKLKRLAQHIIQEIEQEASLTKRKIAGTHVSRDSLLPAGNTVRLQGAFLEESRRIILGIHEVYGAIFDSMGLQIPLFLSKYKSICCKA